MENILIFLLLSPFLTSLILGMFPILNRSIINFISVFGIILSFIASIFLMLKFNFQPFTIFLWPWLSFIFANIAFLIDSLSIVMCVMITFVSIFIAIFSMQFMENDKNLKRYFCYLNLFVGMMLVLVLADNLGLLYLGWEGVGLCSYLLIGFWYEEDKNNNAALKAFITTRVGDLFLLTAIIWIGFYFGTLEFESIFRLLDETTILTNSEALLLALLFLLGAMGKSAQVPLHVWLPDAMVGPTPASALIHAATMVTAGVYLVARVNDFFVLSIVAQNVCLIVGLLTAFLGGIWALAQTDIKKMLAYSTISQIGFMFSALGVGAIWASLFHLISHAFFKALLFLGAGVIGYSFHEYDMNKLSGLRKELPIAFYAFLIGGGALAGLPFITSGFYSKESILLSFYDSRYSLLLIFIGLVLSFITSIYIFKSIFKVFLGDKNLTIYNKPKSPMKISIIILGLCVLLFGFSKEFFSSLFVNRNYHHSLSNEIFIFGLSSLVFFLGVIVAFMTYKNKFLKNIFYFDAIYNAILIQPYKKLCQILYHDILEKFYYWMVRIIFLLSQYIAFLQSGFLHRYMQIFVLALMVMLGIMVAK